MLLGPCARRAGHRLLPSTPRGSTRPYSSPSNNRDKPYYLTTPIFYPNAGTVTPRLTLPRSDLTPVPHIGHLYTLVTTDIFSRHARLARPDSVIGFLTGTDEHGLKIQRAAEAENLEPREFCDRISDRFRVCSYAHQCTLAYILTVIDQDLADKAGTSYTRFIRTSEKDHHYAVQHVWVGNKEALFFFFF